MLNTVFAILLAVTSFSAFFRQEKQSSLLAQPQHSEGVLEYRSPDYLRWEYTGPQPLVWELDGDKGNMNPHMKVVVALIRQAVSGDFDEAEKSFIVERNGDNVTLKPRKRELQRMFRQIAITLRHGTEIAEQVVISEANGDVTTIRFYDVKMLQQ